MPDRVFCIKASRCPTLTWGDPTLPSALSSFTSEFEMESGGSYLLLSRDKLVEERSDETILSLSEGPLCPHLSALNMGAAPTGITKILRLRLRMTTGRGSPRIVVPEIHPTNPAECRSNSNHSLRILPDSPRLVTLWRVPGLERIG